MDKRLIPEVVVKHKNQLGRDLALQRYLDRYKKSRFIAYTLWFILCLLGAHRFYIGNWKHAIALICLSLILLPWLPTVSSYYYTALLIQLVEGVWLFYSLKNSDIELKKRLIQEIDDVPYIPLSEDT